MAKTVVGLFDTLDEAQSVVKDLMSDGFTKDHISLLANNEKGKATQMAHEAGDSHAAEGAGAGAITGTVVGGGIGLVLSLIGAVAVPVIGPIIAAGPILATITGAGIGAAAGGLIGGLTGAGVPDEDANYYAEGVKQGGTLVMVDADDERGQQAYDIMEEHGAVNIEERGAQYRQAGFSKFDPNDTSSYGATNTQAVPMSQNTRTETNQAAPTTSRTLDSGEAVLPVIEEELQVGKRQVQRGGVKVYNRMTETPVEEQVTLHEEKVDVERRPANRAVTDADMAAMKTGTIEVNTMAEEAVISKQAKVVEEVVVGKTAAEHTETIRDSVRRTDVEVEKTAGNGQQMSNGFETYETDFRNRFQTSGKNGGYEKYAPVYQYGYTLANDKQYAGSDWNKVETSARADWEKKNPGNAWDTVKEEVKYAWQKVTGGR